MRHWANPAAVLACVAALASIQAAAQGVPSSRYETRNGSGLSRWEPPASAPAPVTGAGTGVGVGSGGGLAAPPVSGVGVGLGTSLSTSPGSPGLPRRGASSLERSPGLSGGGGGGGMGLERPARP